MKTLIIKTDQENILEIQKKCNEFDKTFEKISDIEIKIMGENLEGLIDKITMGSSPIVLRENIKEL